MKKIAVTGGCGFIGSHTVVDLIQNGYDVISIDSNIRSNPNILEGVEKITGKKIKNYAVDLCDFEKTKVIFQENPDIEGIIHFAALKSVGESTSSPLLYHRNNQNSLINILECCRLYNVKQFIFSSSSSVYGNVKTLPVTEKTPLGEAESPYARTKQVGEMIIKDFAKSALLTQSVILRYFNPAGAHLSGEIGEVSWGKPIYLVPVITDTALGKRESMTVFGTDYDTRDGSCIRDYIYIMDLAHAHTKAIQFLENPINDAPYEIFNLGMGQGVSVLEAILAFEKETGVKLNYTLDDHRDGDVIAVYANTTKANQQLGWAPQYTIEDIMRTAWAWDKKQV